MQEAKKNRAKKPRRKQNYVKRSAPYFLEFGAGPHCFQSHCAHLSEKKKKKTFLKTGVDGR